MVAYAVTAVFESLELVDRYIAWLSGGHVKAVCEGGASSAEIVQIETPSGEHLSMSVRYQFPDRGTLEAYLTEHAPRLRAEGLAQFGPWSGVTFKRSTGVVVHRETKR
jgi:hypothetical protein